MRNIRKKKVGTTEGETKNVNFKEERKENRHDLSKKNMQIHVREQKAVGRATS